MKDYRGAAETLEKANALDPGQATTLLALGIARQLSGMTPCAQWMRSGMIHGPSEGKFVLISCSCSKTLLSLFGSAVRGMRLKMTFTRSDFFSHSRSGYISDI